MGYVTAQNGSELTLHLNIGSNIIILTITLLLELQYHLLCAVCALIRIVVATFFIVHTSGQTARETAP